MRSERLAIDGGQPVRLRELPVWPSFEEDEIGAVASVLRSGKVNYWTGGEGKAFEQEFARFVGSRHAVALANGTVALELALRVLDIGPGDEVIVPSRTFIATASAVVMCGAKPVMADVDPVSQNLTADTVRPVLSSRAKAIIAVHLSGWPCEMDSLRALARERGLRIVEDCAQAHGARYRGKSVGSLGDVAAFSFCQDKIMTTGGEGGMLTTNDYELWQKAWAFKDHGKSFDAVHSHEHPPGFRWLHETFGTNWRMTEMQAAIGRLQLKKLPDWTAARRRNAKLLRRALEGIPAARLTEPDSAMFHSYYKYYFFIRPERLRNGWGRDRIMQAVNAEGIPCYSGSCSEIYLERAFEGQKLRPPGRLPVAKELGATALMLLVHPTLEESDVEDAGRAVKKVLAVAAG